MYHKSTLTRLLNQLIKTAKSDDELKIKHARRSVERHIFGSDKVKKADLRRKVEDAEGWSEIELPHLQFKSHWKVTMSPPHRGAAARFRISNGRRRVAIAADCFDRLGGGADPYWELTPGRNGWFDRFPINDTDALLKGIEWALGEAMIDTKETETVSAY